VSRGECCENEQSGVGHEASSFFFFHAYYEGTVVAPDDGGRVLFAEVPEGWSKLGFPEVDCNGDKCYYRILKNIPGRRDAGRIWAQHYDSFLRRQGFTQSIVNLRVFVKHLPHGKLFIVAVYVDDNWTVCDDDSEWDRFHTAWKLEFEESSNVVEAENDFCGVRYDDMPDGSLELSCGKLIHELEAMISEFPSPDNCDTPMVGDALLRMRENNSQSMTASKRSWRNWRITRQMSANNLNMELSSKPCKWVSGASCSMRATCWLRANCKMWICA